MYVGQISLESTVSLLCNINTYMHVSQSLTILSEILSIDTSKIEYCRTCFARIIFRADVCHKLINCVTRLQI